MPRTYPVLRVPEQQHVVEPKTLYQPQSLWALQEVIEKGRVEEVWRVGSEDQRTKGCEQLRGSKEVLIDAGKPLEHRLLKQTDGSNSHLWWQLFIAEEVLQEAEAQGGWGQSENERDDPEGVVPDVRIRMIACDMRK